MFFQLQKTEKYEVENTQVVTETAQKMERPVLDNDFVLELAE